MTENLAPIPKASDENPQQLESVSESEETQTTNDGKLSQEELIVAEKSETVKKKQRFLPIFTLRFLRGSMHLFFRLSLSFFVFYFLGNYYNFLDTSQLLILQFLQIASTLSVITSVLLLALQIAFFIKNKKTSYLKFSITPIVFFILSLGLTFFSTVIVFISRI
ncbi:MAG: hypothetical protein P1P64_06965 [Treponemataceae bacterium]